jgi:hypothetical protein
MSSRHRLIFAGAMIAFVASCLAFASVRMYLVHWWMAKCGESSASCRAAEFGIDYWWLALLCLAAVIAATAHWLTLGRLALADAPPPSRVE